MHSSSRQSTQQPQQQQQRSLVAVDGLAPGAIAGSEVTSLPQQQQQQHITSWRVEETQQSGGTQHASMQCANISTQGAKRRQRDECQRNVYCAVLCCAVLCCAVLCCVVLCCAVLC
jgi:hypothetical protein